MSRKPVYKSIRIPVAPPKKVIANKRKKKLEKIREAD